MTDQTQANRDCMEALAEAMHCAVSLAFGNSWHPHYNAAMTALRLAEQDGANIADCKASLREAMLDLLDNLPE